MSRSIVAFGVVGMVFGLLAGCSNIRGSEAIDPDLQAMQGEQAAQPEAELPPDEVIGPPDAPGVEVAEEEVVPTGPTQHVVLSEDGPAGNDKVVAPPKRTKSPSMMGDLLWGPRDN